METKSEVEHEEAHSPSPAKKPKLEKDDCSDASVPISCSLVKEETQVEKDDDKEVAASSNDIATPVPPPTTESEDKGDSKPCIKSEDCEKSSNENSDVQEGTEKEIETVKDKKVAPIIIKIKRPKEKSSSKNAPTNDSENPGSVPATKKKFKKKKKKLEKKSPKPSEILMKQKAANLRKNIKDILRTESLGEETLAAQREEAERRERMNLKLQQLKLMQAHQATLAGSNSLIDSILDLVNPVEQEVQIPLSSSTDDEKIFNQQQQLPETPLPETEKVLVVPEEVQIFPNTYFQDEIVLSSDEETAPKQLPLPPPVFPTKSELRTHLESLPFPTFRNPYIQNRYNYNCDSTEQNVISLSSGDEEDTCDSEVNSFTNGYAQHSVPNPNIRSTLPINETVAKDTNESDDDCVVLSPTPEKEEINMVEKDLDELNIRDEFGRVLVNVGHPDEDPDIFLAPQTARIVKPHQIGGIRFLYDNVVESVERFNTASGFGCILAHSMGLGKTLQAVSFCDVFLRGSNSKTVLIIVPINTIQNWLNEFNVWLPSKKPENAKQDKKAKNPPVVVAKPNPPSPQSLMNESISDTVSLNLSFDSTLNLLTEEEDRIEESAPPTDTGEVHLRGFEVFVLNETVKTLQAREKIISNWSTKGGVMLIGYEMYRMLALRKLKRSKKQSTFFPDESQSEAATLNNIHSFIVDPGPDLVICDEGHRIKNSGASISQALKSIRTKRRVVLTGYPLQNNLMEYWCMVDFIRPNYLGSKVEFSNMFERPISNGQCVDSTPEDRRLMRFRSHVLHSLLEGFVQRRSHAVLHNVLPEKQEWVFLLKMTPVQYRLYKEFMQYLSDNNEGQNGANPIKAFAVCCKIWNHPDALYNVVRKKQSILDDLDLDDEVNGSSNDAKARNGRGKKPEKDNRLAFFDGGGFNFPKNHFGNIGTYNKSGTEALSLDWALPVFENYEPGVLENGVKFEILFEIIKETVAVKDKLLVFSQTLLSLDLIESFFHKKFNWIKNCEYYRLDGSTTGLERERLINNFNSKKDVFVFLVSTRAGSLGINLTGANRVVVLDASWNPCHDCQAVCRIYRYGQKKPCQIYRFVSDCTLEKRIYDRQINKRGMSDRVVDEMNPNAQFRTKDVSSFLVLKHDHLDKLPYIKCDLDPQKYSDPILRNILLRQGDKLTQAPFEHESLLIDQKSQRLSATEKRLAHRNYLSEKRTAELQTSAGYSYSRPSYAAYYPSTCTTSNNPSRFINTNPKIKPGNEDKFEQHVPALRLKGICVQSIVLKKDSFLTDPSGGPDMYLMAGEKIYVLRSEKGTYLRISNGKLIAVRNSITNPRCPVLNVPSNQELPKEQLLMLVNSFLTVPGYRQSFNSDSSSYSSSGQQQQHPYSPNSYTHPMEQPLPPSASFFSQNKNNLQVTNTSGSGSGGNVTLWQGQNDLINDPNNTAATTTRSSTGNNNNSLHALLDSNSGNVSSNFNPNLEKLSHLASKFANLSQRKNNDELELQQRNSFHPQPSFSLSQYPNLSVQKFPQPTSALQSSSDVELIRIPKSNGRGNSPASIPITTSTSLDGYPPFTPSIRSKPRSDNNGTQPKSRDVNANSSFYEDFTITVKNPKTTSSSNNQHFSPSYQNHHPFPDSSSGEFYSQNSQNLLSHQDAMDVNNVSSSAHDFRNLSQYYNNTATSSSSSDSVPPTPYFPDHSV